MGLSRRILAPFLSLLCSALCAVTAVADEPASVFPTIDPARMRANLVDFSSDEFNGRSFRSEEGKRAAEWLARKLAEAGAKPLEGRDSMLVPVARMPAASPNVVAWIPPAGPKPSGEFILVTAHYDHLPPRSSAGAGEDRIYNGADDNASGVCGVIAVAEALRADKLNVGVVLVGFTGEEAGLVGSRAFVEEETLPVPRIRGMFNMDMISRQPDGAIRLDGGPKGKVLTELLVRLAPKVPIEMKVDTHPDWLMRSDQGAFLGAGVPAVLFSCEDHEDYHKVTDHADKADPALMAKVATLIAGAVRTFAAEMSPRFDLTPLASADLASGARTLRIGRPAANAPYWKPSTRRDPNKGLDHDLIQELAKKLGWKTEEKTVRAGEEEKALESGEVDVIANGFMVTAARSERFALTAPYLRTSGIGALIKKDAPIKALADLAGKKIAVADGSPEEAWALERAEGASIGPADGPIGMATGRIERGELDALLGDFAVLDARAKRDPAFSALLLEAMPVAFAFRKGDAAVAALVSEHLARMESDGTLAPVRAKYGLEAAATAR
jgi:ABC-type amino acid transport substrate-binding protein